MIPDVSERRGLHLFDGGTVPAGVELASSQVSSTGVIMATWLLSPDLLRSGRALLVQGLSEARPRRRPG